MPIVTLPELGSAGHYAFLIGEYFAPIGDGIEPDGVATRPQDAEFSSHYLSYSVLT
jgi:hypothetical protein